MTDRLWSAIVDLYELIWRDQTAESQYQLFFEKHPVIFEVLGYDCQASFENRSRNNLPHDRDLNKDQEPDFIAGSSVKRHLEVVEIKTPIRGRMLVERRDGGRKKFRAEIEEYISQANEYKEHLERNQDARDAASAVLGFSTARNFGCTLICGLYSEQDAPEIKRLASIRNITFIFYDELFTILVKAYAEGRPMDTALHDMPDELASSVTILVIVDIDNAQNNDPAYVFDVAGEHTSPFSLMCCAGDLVFRFQETSGRYHEQLIQGAAGKILPVLFEFAVSRRGTFISLRLWGDEVEVDQKIRAVDYESTTRLTIGANKINTEHCKMKFYGPAVFRTGRPLTLQQRIETILCCRELYGTDQSTNPTTPSEKSTQEH